MSCFPLRPSCWKLALPPSSSSGSCSCSSQLLPVRLHPTGRSQTRRVDSLGFSTPLALHCTLASTVRRCSPPPPPSPLIPGWKWELTQNHLFESGDCQPHAAALTLGVDYFWSRPPGSLTDQCLLFQCPSLVHTLD